MPRIPFMLAAAGLLAACGQPRDPTASASTDAPAAVSRPASGPSADATSPARTLPAGTSLSQRIDCLRENGATMVIAHRGGPTRDFPENAMETFARTMNAGLFGMEIDIAESRDGVLFLMHDDDLSRTSTGEGEVSETSWADIEKMKLETYSTATEFHPPTLEAALEWAVANDILLELDKKRSTSYDGIIEAVERTRAQNNVLMITYTDEQAIDLHSRAPNLMITASIDSIATLDRLVAAGVKEDHLVAWTGTEAPNPQLWQALAKRGVESIFGTLGRRGERLDDRYWEDDDGSEYNALANDGLTFVVTDLSDKVARQLRDTESAPMQACGW